MTSGSRPVSEVALGFHQRQFPCRHLADASQFACPTHTPHPARSTSIGPAVRVPCYTTTGPRPSRSAPFVADTLVAGSAPNGRPAVAISAPRPAAQFGPSLRRSRGADSNKCERATSPEGRCVSAPKTVPPAQPTTADSARSHGTLRRFSPRWSRVFAPHKTPLRVQATGFCNQGISCHDSGTGRVLIASIKGA